MFTFKQFSVDDLSFSGSLSFQGSQLTDCQIALLMRQDSGGWAKWNPAIEDERKRHHEAVLLRQFPRITPECGSYIFPWGRISAYIDRRECYSAIHIAYS